jgi:hypothetical protein
VCFVVLMTVWSCESCERPQHAWTPLPPAKGQPGKEFDLEVTPTDYNGSPQNPAWISETEGRRPPWSERCARTPFESACTSQKPSLDSAQFPNILICSFELASKLKGHANWTVASSVGDLLWLNFAADRDFTFMFFPDGNTGLTSRNSDSKDLAEGPPRPFIELEFDSRETVAHFRTDWWVKFAEVVRRHRSGLKIQEFLNPSSSGTAVRSVVYGLFGLDCEHKGQSEFHPVYAMAIEVDPTPLRNKWVLFVRNWGNEGFCSSLDHRLDLPDGKLRLTLPRRGTRPTVDASATQFASTRSRVPFPEVAFDKVEGNEGQIVLTFALPPDTERVDAELVLTLQWPELTPKPPITPGRPTMRLLSTAVAALSAQPPQRPESPERYLERAIAQARLSREELDRRMAVAVPAIPNVIQRVPTPVMVVDFVRPAPSPMARPRGRLALALSADKAARDGVLIDALCQATGGAPPHFNGRDVSEMCRTR